LSQNRKLAIFGWWNNTTNERRLFESLKFRKHFRLKNLLILNIPNLLDILFEIANSSMKDSFTLNERRENFQNPFFVDKNGID
jgi:hypothetical protein